MFKGNNLRFSACSARCELLVGVSVVLSGSAVKSVLFPVGVVVFSVGVVLFPVGSVVSLLSLSVLFGCIFIVLLIASVGCGLLAEVVVFGDLVGVADVPTFVFG